MAHSCSFGFSELLVASRLAAEERHDRWTLEIVASPRAARTPFLIAAGLEQALDVLAEGAWSGLEAEGTLAALQAACVDPELTADDLACVAAQRFGGEVDAVPEGTVVFAGEPILRLRAPAAEAVAFAAAITAVIRTQSSVATAVARMRQAAEDKPVYEMADAGIGRTAGLAIARAAHLGGASATTNPLAAGTFGIPALPVVGLSWVEGMGGGISGLGRFGVAIDSACERDVDALLAALRVPPRFLLIDGTGAGDALAFAQSLRARLDALGWGDARLLMAGDLDEESIARLTGADAVAGFAISAATLQAIARGLAHLECELVESEVDGRRTPRRRFDGGFGPRDVWRRRERGVFRGDVVQPQEHAPPPRAVPLLVPVVERGRKLFDQPSLAELRVQCESQLGALDPAVSRRLDPHPYSITVVAPDPSPLRPPAPRPAAAAPQPRLIDRIDDSADFTAVSDALASVFASRLAPSGLEPSPEPVEPTPVEPGAELEAFDFEEIPPPESESEPPARACDPQDLGAGAGSGEAVEAVVKVEEVVEVEAVVEAEAVVSAPIDPILAAADRLRALQRGAAEAPPRPTLRTPSIVEPVVEPAAPAAAADPPPADPLLAAAARLRRLRRGP